MAEEGVGTRHGDVGQYQFLRKRRGDVLISTKGAPIDTRRCDTGEMGQEVGGLAAVERRHKEDVIASLQLVVFFPLELPVGIVDENENARTAGVDVSPVGAGKSRKGGLTCVRRGRTGRAAGP